MSATPTTATRAIDVARSFFTAYNAHDVGKMVAACSEDAQLRYVPMGAQGQGKVREVGKAIWSGIIDAFPDLTVTVQSVFGDERNAAAEVMIGGTQRKDFRLMRRIRCGGPPSHPGPTSVEPKRKWFMNLGRLISALVGRSAGYHRIRLMSRISFRSPARASTTSCRTRSS
jgi:ketosteroid isomerase-like protein